MPPATAPLAACWSAALTAIEQHRLLHLPVPEEDQRHLSPARPEPSPPAQSPGALATELTSRLGCAVLAMRYPVNDDFAIDLSGKLYDLLTRQGQALPRAVALTLQDLGQGDRHGQAYSALSLAAPAGGSGGSPRASIVAGTPDAIARNAPAGAPPRLLVEAVDALTADEALMLARELPHLRDLIYGDLPGIDRDAARELALGVLNVAQGHPKLLELADGQAAHLEQLTALVEAGDQAWQDQGGLPEGFFTTGETAAAPGDYLQVLAAWTKSVSATLSPGERDLFWFLCCLEEPDRIRPVLDSNWTNLWQRLDRDGQPPSLDQALSKLAARGLIAIRVETDEENESYAIHPGVAAAGRDHAGQDFQASVDSEVGDFWHAIYEHASGGHGDGSVDTGLQVRAGLAAGPYLLRQEHWDTAAYLLHNAFARDPSRANAVVMLPATTRIANHDPRHAIALARVLQALDPAAADTRLRAYLDAAAARGDYRAAAVTAGQLTDLCADSGRLAEALTLTDRQADYTRQAGLDLWTQLADQGQRLQVLAAMGHTKQVLDDVQRLRRYMDTLPARPGANEAVYPWEVREALLDVGRFAALRLDRWQDALDLNAEITASQHDHHAPVRRTARTRFNDYGPLLGLGRTSEALDLLLDCRQVFHDTGDIQGLGKTLGALAHTEDQRGHGNAALRLERDALRYKYFIGIGGAGAQSAATAIRSAANDLGEFGTAAEPPADIADLCRRLAYIPGTSLPGLIEKLSPDPQTAEQTLQDLIAQAREQAETPRGVRDNE